MQQYRAIIVDDERGVRDALDLLLKQFCPEIQAVGFAASAEEGRKLLNDLEVDFIFLDISMPREDGFAFLLSIPRDNYGIIFVTAYEEFALRAFRANAIDYLLKPVNPEELVEAVAKAVRYRELRRVKADVRTVYNESLDNLHAYMAAGTGQIGKITIAEQFGFRIVNVCELMYLQADSNYTILHLSGLDKIVATKSLGEFEKMLEHPCFFRIHKSSIINMKFLKGYSSHQGNFAELTDGTRLSISRRKLIEFRDAVTHFSKSIG